jgi:hypothetical protein
VAKIMAEKNNFKDLTGKVFGNWTILKRVDYSPRTHHSTVYLCKCVCGKERERFRTNIIAGKNSGCGCVPWNILTRPYEALYRVFLREATRSGRLENFSYEDFLIFTRIEKCHYCGEHILWTKTSTGKNGNGYHLDRKDNSLGYSKENCVVCCPRCNRAKSNHFTYEEWVEIGALIKSWKTNPQNT